jgi:hypothetical protein
MRNELFDYGPIERYAVGTGSSAVACRFFRTFDQATAPVSTICIWQSGRMFMYHLVDHADAAI